MIVPFPNSWPTLTDGLVFISAGLPPLTKDADIIYKYQFRKFCFLQRLDRSQHEAGRLAERNKVYYEKYFEDVQRVKDIIRYIQKENITLPSGGNFSVLRLRQLGVYFAFHGLLWSYPKGIRYITDLKTGTMDIVHGKHYLGSQFPANQLEDMICRFTSDLSRRFLLKDIVSLPCNTRVLNSGSLVEFALGPSSYVQRCMLTPISRIRLLH